MASRKTVNIAKLIDTLEAKIAATDDVNVKAALCDIIADTLHETGNYRGFGYSFYTYDASEKYGSVDAAIEAGLGTEYDRWYYTAHLR